MDRVHSWADAEIERIHQAEARRLNKRKARLDDHLAQHAALIGAETDRVEAAVEDYRAQLASFLVRLADEPSPIQIARLAADLPETPDFDAIRASARAEAVAILTSHGIDFHPAPVTTPPASTTRLHPNGAGGGHGTRRVRGERADSAGRTRLASQEIVRRLGRVAFPRRAQAGAHGHRFALLAVLDIEAVVDVRHVAAAGEVVAVVGRAPVAT